MIEDMVRRFTNTSANSRWGEEENIIFPLFSNKQE
ncbi:hypothetical protein protein [Bacillus cereus G9241]|nr:hypothetical protein protein [Bacillus cereus G9241]